MQDTQEANLGSETGWIGGNFPQGCGAGIEQEAEQELLVLPH